MKKLLSLFSAAPTRSDYVDSADLFRVLCILMIAWFHIWQQSWQNPNPTIFGRTYDILYPVVTCGYMLVDCMILLSGFLLMLGYLNGRMKDAKSFYRTRAYRILPCYYLFLVIQLCFYILPNHRFFGDVERGLIDTLSHFTLTQNFFYEGYIDTQFSGVLWTLAVEVQFYLLFPWICDGFKSHPLRSWAVMTACGFFARYYVHRYCPDTSMFFNQLPALLDVYANGMLASVIWVRLSHSKPQAWRAWLSTILSVAAFYGIFRILCHQRMFAELPDIRQNQMNDRFLLTALGSVFLVTSGRSIVLFRQICSNPLTRFLSAVSFNFYMWHAFITLRLKEWNIPPHISETPYMVGEQPWQTLYTLCCFGFSLLIAALLTYLVERPCTRWLKKHTIF